MIQTAPVHCLEAYVPAPFPALRGRTFYRFAISLRGCTWESEHSVLFVATNQIGARVPDAQCQFNKAPPEATRTIWQQASLSSNSGAEFRRQWTWGWPECKACWLPEKQTVTSCWLVRVTTAFVCGHG
jgi:hypothetical protein